MVRFIVLDMELNEDFFVWSDVLLIRSGMSVERIFEILRRYVVSD